MSVCFCPFLSMLRFSLWDEFYNMKTFNFNYISFSPFFSLHSRLNRNKLQFLPELLFQSNPKLGRLWVHLSCFSISPSSDPTFLNSPVSRWLSLHRSLSALFCLFWCVTWSIWKHGHGAMSELSSGLRVQVPRQVTQCRSVLLSRGEKECVCQMCACVRVCAVLRGESAPGVNVLLGPVRNFYSGIWSFPRVFRV